MIKRREKTKHDHVRLGIEIFEKRYQAKDFNGYLLAEYTNNAVKSRFVCFVIILIDSIYHLNPNLTNLFNKFMFDFRSAFTPLYGNQYPGQQSNQYWSNSGYATGGNASLLNKHGNNDIDGVHHNNNRKEKRQYKKRKHKNQREKQATGKIINLIFVKCFYCNLTVVVVVGSTIDHLASSDDEEQIINLNHIGHDTENEGQYPFRRSTSCQYHRVGYIFIFPPFLKCERHVLMFKCTF